MGLVSLRDSKESRANPQNLPLSLTEKTKSTLRHWRNAWFNLASFCGGVDHTPKIISSHYPFFIDAKRNIEKLK